MSLKKIIDYLGKDSVYNFIGNMSKKVKYCEEAMKKKFNKELVVNDDEGMDMRLVKASSD